MRPAEFRRIALSFPGAEESQHMGHPDFRVGGRIFATLGWPDEAWGVVKLTPEQQRLFVEQYPHAFAAVSGGWGRRGSTQVNLKQATATLVRRALACAWQNRAPAARKPTSTPARHPRKRKNRA